MSTVFMKSIRIATVGEKEVQNPDGGILWFPGSHVPKQFHEYWFHPGDRGVGIRSVIEQNFDGVLIVERHRDPQRGNAVVSGCLRPGSVPEQADEFGIIVLPDRDGQGVSVGVIEDLGEANRFVRPGADQVVEHDRVLPIPQTGRDTGQQDE